MIFKEYCARPSALGNNLKSQTCAFIFHASPKPRQIKFGIEQAILNWRNNYTTNIPSPFLLFTPLVSS